MKKLLCVLLTMGLLLAALCACGQIKFKLTDGDTEQELSELKEKLEELLGSSEEGKTISFGEKDLSQALIGKWVSEIDVGESIQDELDEDVQEYVDCTGITLKFYLTFSSDGTYVFGANDESIDDFAGQIFRAVEKGLGEYVQNYAKENEMSVSDLLDSMGYDSIRELTEDSLDPDDLRRELENSFEEADGEYFVKDGDLYMDDELVEFDLTGNTLKLYDEAFEDLFGVAEMELKKA